MASLSRKTSQRRTLGFLVLVTLISVWVTVLLTALANLILELMRWIGPWLGLGMAASGLVVALLVVPALGKKRYPKRSLTTLVAIWCGLQLSILFLFFPVGRWFRDRGSFVPSLLLGPNQAVVKRVVVGGLNWGEDWKLRPGLRDQKAFIEAESLPTPSPHHH